MRPGDFLALRPDSDGSLHRTTHRIWMSMTREEKVHGDAFGKGSGIFVDSFFFMVVVGEHLPYACIFALFWPLVTIIISCR